MQITQVYVYSLDIFKDFGMVSALLVAARYRWPRNFNGGWADGTDLYIHFKATPRTLKRIDRCMKAWLKYKNTVNVDHKTTDKMFAWKG